MQNKYEVIHIAEDQLTGANLVSHHIQRQMMGRRAIK
jgi:hypothetical protein